MKNKVVNSTIGTISKDLKLSMKAISEVSNPVTTMKAASDAISNTVATFLAFEKLTNPFHQICKFNDYIIEETDGSMNSYGELISRVVAEG